MDNTLSCGYRSAINSIVVIRASAPIYIGPLKRIDKQDDFRLYQEV